MKRRQITSIFLALAVAVASSALLTGCAAKSYYYTHNEDGYDRNGAINLDYGTKNERVGKIPDQGGLGPDIVPDTTVDPNASKPSDDTEPVEDSEEETSVIEEPSETEEPSEAEEFSETEEPSEAEESSEAEEPSEAGEPSEAETPRDENTLAVVKVQIPDDIDAETLEAVCHGDEKISKIVPAMKGDDGLYVATLPKTNDQNEEIVNAQLQFQWVVQKGSRYITKQSNNVSVNGDKTYTLSADGKLTEQ